MLADSKNSDPVRIPVHRKIRPVVGYAWPTRYIIGYHFRAARALVGLDHLHFHDLRHGTASDPLSQSHALAVVGKVLRHKRPTSTARYAHLHDSALAQAIDSIGRKRA